MDIPLRNFVIGGVACQLPSSLMYNLSVAESDHMYLPPKKMVAVHSEAKFRDMYSHRKDIFFSKSLHCNLLLTL